MKLYVAFRIFLQLRWALQIFYVSQVLKSYTNLHRLPGTHINCKNIIYMAWIPQDLKKCGTTMCLLLKQSIVCYLSRLCTLLTSHKIHRASHHICKRNTSPSPRSNFKLVLAGNTLHLVFDMQRYSLVGIIEYAALINPIPFSFV